jgi:hypothetical protein
MPLTLLELLRNEKKPLLPALLEPVEGQYKYTAMVRQAHHERSLNDWS